MFEKNINKRITKIIIMEIEENKEVPDVENQPKLVST